MDHLEQSMDSLSKRGPDAGGIFRHGPVGLGHRRLSIIDTSDAGNQPMSDPSGRYTVVFNGEIFNYRELREDLLGKGLSFTSESDTEVLLHLFIREGAAFLNRLNGFFAMAIYDRDTQNLFLARDRIGIKPLLYYQDDDRLVFGSEMKALMAFPVPRNLDRVSLYQYLQCSYISAPASIFEGVSKLLPGHYLQVGKEGVQMHRYYELPFPEAPITISYEAQQERLRDLLEDSIRLRLVADVPLGAFLSGGIDSSIVVALASRHTSRLNTFSIGFKDQPYFDETKYANLVAKKFSTHHTVFSLTNEEMFASLFDMLDYVDEPFADSSALLVNILSMHTRRHVTVALSGDGADELFAGYHKYAGELRARQGGTLAIGVKALLPLWKALPKSRSSFLGNKTRQLHRFAEGARLSEKERYWRWSAFASEQEALGAFSEPALLNQPAFQKRKEALLGRLHHPGDMNEVLYTDVMNVLPNDMLHKVDSMSMARSLEVRVPFLDHRVAELAFSLPVESKINAKHKKRILQDAFREVLPAELYHRPKQGFDPPLLQWLQTGLRSLITEDLLSERFVREQALFSPEYISGLLRRLFSRDPGDVHEQVWALIVFQYWYKRYMM